MNRDRQRARRPLLILVIGLLGIIFFSGVSSFPNPSILDRDEVRGACLGICLGMELTAAYHLYRIKRNPGANC